MEPFEFDAAFAALTGHPPFPWQRALYDRFVSDRLDHIPAACDLPTGLGKTSVIAVWLAALLRRPDRMPRRLVYVVNRRTVVDQTTDEVEKLRKNLPGLSPPFGELAVSTLRGQFADNRAWSADPSRPAVVCGTVDMIGSRLLFGGYGVGFKGKPLHAGFLGQDALVVHDEAHLEPAFQELLVAIQKEQHEGERTGVLPWPKLRVMELSATPRGGGDVFPNEAEKAENEAHPVVQQRVGAKKAIHLHEAKDDKKVAEELADRAVKEHGESGRAVLIFVRRVDDVDKIVRKLPKGSSEQLTGTLRGKERDGLVKKPIFQRFLPPSNRDPAVTPAGGTVYLVCTSAGEVGVNISADHLVCDLSTFDGMAQRFGRVNRFGVCDDTRVDVVCPTAFDTDNDLEVRRAKTLALLRDLNGDGSPAALGALPLERRVAAFSPPPVVLPVSDILFDAWALTTIKGKLPGRPMIEPYLHGVEDEKSFETQFAWREEVDRLTGKVPDDALGELLADFPLKPHELLRVATFGKGRAYDQLDLIAEREGGRPAWVVEPDGEVTVYPSLRDLTKKVGKDYAVPLAARTVVLPPKAGGLSPGGMLAGDVAYAETIPYDVAGRPSAKVPPLLRVRVVRSGDDLTLSPFAPVENWLPDEPIEGRGSDGVMALLNEALGDHDLPRARVALRLDLSSGDDDDGDGAAGSYLIVRPVQRKESGPPEWPALDGHLVGVHGFAEGIVGRLGLEPGLAKAVVLAAAWHDIGKGRAVWQRGAGNRPTHEPIAKTLHGRPPENLSHYRHELGSMADVLTHPKFADEYRALDPDQQAVVLHLIATHHGRGRPHFPPAEVVDRERPDALTAAVAGAVPRRYARLQRRYGRWGLAYLESLLRAADALESRRIESCAIPDPIGGVWPGPPAELLPVPAVAVPEPTIRVAVDPTNPGQFFACCGLLELADRLWPESGAEGWFAADGREFHIAAGGDLGELLFALADAEINSSLTNQELKRLASLLSANKSTLSEADTAEKARLSALWKRERVHVSKPFDLWSDWWFDDQTGGKAMKTWAAKQMVLDVARPMLRAVKDGKWHEDATRDVLTRTAYVAGVPFYFDAHSNCQSTPRDLGFGLYTLRNDIDTQGNARPLLELACFLGLQRFRPAVVTGTKLLRYSLWPVPLPVAAAGVAASGQLCLPGERHYAFRMLFRSEYMKAFLPAEPYHGG